MASVESPTMHQRRLRIELRKARDAAGLTQEQVATALDWSLSKVIRIEAGTVNVSITDLRALLQQYGVSPERVEELVVLARAARERAWWSSYRKILSQSYLDRIGYEAAASAIRQYETLVVPALLQTSDYAEAYLRGMTLPGSAPDIDQLVEVRMRRQEILERETPPTLHVILDEAVVRRHIGGPQVMRRQLRHLVEMATRPNITIEVVPFTAGVYPGLRGAFSVLEFPSAEDDDVLHLESPRDTTISRDLREDVVTYREIFQQLHELSLGPEGSAVLLNTLAESMGAEAA